MFKASKEYIAFVSKYLIPKQLVWWVKQDSSDWNAFYCFLEKQAKEACQIQVLQKTRLGCQYIAAEPSVLQHLDPMSFLGLLLKEAVESIPVQSILFHPPNELLGGEILGHQGYALLVSLEHVLATCSVNP